MLVILTKMYDMYLQHKFKMTPTWHTLGNCTDYILQSKNILYPTIMNKLTTVRDQYS